LRPARFRLNHKDTELFIRGIVTLGADLETTPRNVAALAHQEAGVLAGLLLKLADFLECCALLRCAVSDIASSLGVLLSLRRGIVALRMFILGRGGQRQSDGTLPQLRDARRPWCVLVAWLFLLMAGDCRPVQQRHQYCCGTECQWLS
jgi:hypothetical protein